MNVRRPRKKKSTQNLLHLMFAVGNKCKKRKEKKERKNNIQHGSKNLRLRISISFCSFVLLFYTTCFTQLLGDCSCCSSFLLYYLNWQVRRYWFWEVTWKISYRTWVNQLLSICSNYYCSLKCNEWILFFRKLILIKLLCGRWFFVACNLWMECRGLNLKFCWVIKDFLMVCRSWFLNFFFFCEHLSSFEIWHFYWKLSW